jgi:hypothetical protein
MAAGVTDRLWEVSDIVTLMEAVEAKPGEARTLPKINRLKCLKCDFTRTMFPLRS